MLYGESLLFQQRTLSVMTSSDKKGIFCISHKENQKMPFYAF